MRNTDAIIERVRARTDTGTNYAVAKALGMSPSNMARVMKEGGTLGNEACFRAAALLNIDPADVIAYIEEDRAPTPEKKEFWRARLPRVLPTIAAAAFAIVGQMVGVNTDHLSAAMMLAVAVPSNLAIHYAYWMAAAAVVLILMAGHKFTLGLAARTRVTAAA